MAQYTPMMEQYLAIKANYKDAFLFFRLGDFYELFFEDAILAARELEITLTGREGGIGERIPMCGVPYHSVDNYLQILLRKGYKIAICEQVEDPKAAKGVVRREVVRVLTPGTVMEGSMLPEKENNYLVAAVTGTNQFSLAACDISTGELQVAIFHSLDQLAAELLSFRPKEILIQDGERSNVLKQKCESMGAKNIQLLHKDESTESIIDELPIEASLQQPLLNQVISLLFTYIKETQKKSLSHIQKPRVYESAKYMFLDTYTKRNLEIMETLMEKEKTGSLLWFLDHTTTAMGARAIRQWLDKPLIDQQDIEQRLDAVQHLAEHLFTREQVRDCLKHVYDLERLAGRISFGNANAKDLINLKHSLEKIPELKRLFLEEGEVPLLMQHILGEMEECEDVVQIIDKAIVDDPPISLKEGGLIKKGLDDHLDKLKRVSSEGKHWIAALEQQEREITGIRSLKIGYNKVFGYYIEVTKANLPSIPEGRYERKQTLANAERFVTEQLKEQEALILEAEEQLTELEYHLFTEIREQIACQVERLQKTAKQVAALDVLSTLAQVAQEQRLVRPRIVGDGRLFIKDGRHPVVEKVLKEQRFITNDTVMDQEKNRLLLITGPNMAGKSTYMRQVGLIVILAQIGSFVPASEAELSLTDRIFTRIGAADDLVGGQSTFMVEMKDIQQMTTQATSHSLVIIDEIGRGTSTHDGLSIAQAVIEYLQETVGCKSIISTHFHELAVLEDTLPGLKNYHMAVEERDNNVIFLRKLKRGSTDESYGIYCAKVAGLPETIISRSEELLKTYRDESQIGKDQHTQSIKEDVIQLDLFASLSERKKDTPEHLDKKSSRVIKELKDVDLINMTPLQALNYLFELKQRVKELK